MPAKKRAADKDRGNEQLKQKKSKEDAEEENSSLEPSKPMMESSFLLMRKLDSAFLVKHPKEVLEFWENAVWLNSKAPKEAFSELASLKLIGPFDFISDFSNSAVDLEHRSYLVESRFPTDLPEMETIMTYADGRFCYWRDEPKETPRWLVHVSNGSDNFPEFTIVGDSDPRCAVQYLLLMAKTKALKKFAHFLDDDDSYDQKHLQSLKRKRAKESVGMPFHGMAIKVDVDAKSVGYRPVSDDKNENNRLKRDIETLATSEDEEAKKAVKERLYRIYSCVQFANDELDFGMGLEFGHDLFVANYACLDGMTKAVLKTAYALLGREEFGAILEKHWEAGRRRADAIDSAK